MAEENIEDHNDGAQPMWKNHQNAKQGKSIKQWIRWK